MIQHTNGFSVEEIQSISDKHSIFLKLWGQKQKQKVLDVKFKFTKKLFYTDPLCTMFRQALKKKVPLRGYLTEKVSVSWVRRLRMTCWFWVQQLGFKFRTTKCSWRTASRSITRTEAQQSEQSVQPRRRLQLKSSTKTIFWTRGIFSTRL